MRRIVSLLSGMVFAFSANAQKDSLKTIRLSGCQAEIGTHFFPDHKQLSADQYRSFVKNNALLNGDFSNYQLQNGYMYTAYQGLTGIRFFATIQDKKRIKKEISFGLKYGEESNVGTYLYRSRYDTVSVYKDVDGTNYYKVQINASNYNFVIRSEKLLMPLGFNFTSDKQKRLWITYGAEFTPFINFNYVFEASYGSGYSYKFVKEGDSLNSPDNLVSNNTFGNYAGKVERTKLSGIGYGAYVSLPFSIYLHPFLKARFLKHINLMGSLTPGFVYSYSKFDGPGSIAGISVATGIRYNW